MSRAFIDSHIALWIGAGGTSISLPVARAINSHRQVCVSALTFAELEMKQLLGKISGVADLALRLKEHSIEIEPFDQESAAAVARFPNLVRHDPFDRMIFAQAASKPNTTFFTADVELISLGLDWVVDARA